MGKYILELRGEFDSIKDIDEYRLKNPAANGEVWTHSGHQVNEDFARICENLEWILKNFTSKEHLLRVIGAQKEELVKLIEEDEYWEILMSNLRETDRNGKLPESVLLREKNKKRLNKKVKCYYYKTMEEDKVPLDKDSEDTKIKKFIENDVSMLFDKILDCLEKGYTIILTKNGVDIVTIPKNNKVK